MTELTIPLILAFVLGLGTAFGIVATVVCVAACMLSSKINQQHGSFNLGGRWTQEELDAAEAFAKEMAKLWDEQHE